jgi:hypothetical protein
MYHVIIKCKIIAILLNMKYLLLILSLIFTTIMHAQTSGNIAGAYYLQGVMETGSGFKLNADSSFQFFYSYGALDRYGSGKWKVENNKVILNSKPYPGKDFKMTNSTKNSDGFTTIRIDDKNPQLFSFVHCLVHTKNGDTLLDADHDGYIIIKEKSIDTIYLISELSAERVSAFTINTKNNFYAFSFEPWIFEVFFKEFSLQFIKDHLEGKHPLLRGENYRYIKEE